MYLSFNNNLDIFKIINIFFKIKNRGQDYRA